MKPNCCKTDGWWTMSRCDFVCPRSGHFVAGGFRRTLPSPDATLGDGFFAARKTPPFFRRAFTLIELILVLALLVIITSIAAPTMSKFIRGRALDTEARRLMSLIHLGQSRAVSEGLPMMLWLDTANGTYGLQAETSGTKGDSKAEELTVDSTLRLTVVNLGIGAQTTFNNLPAIKFLADGTIDENSPQTVQLVDADGFGRVFTENKTRTGYEVDSAK